MAGHHLPRRSFAVKHFLLRSRLTSLGLALCAGVLRPAATAAQVARAGYIPETSPEQAGAPHYPPVLFVAGSRQAGRGLPPGTSAHVRADAWWRGVGLALGGGYELADDCDARSAVLHTALLIRIRSETTRVPGAASHAQLGFVWTPGRAASRWEVPLSIGLDPYIPIPSFPLIGHTVVRPWLAGELITREGLAAPAPGVGLGIWLYSNQSRASHQGWGLLAGLRARRVGNASESLLDVSLTRVLASTR